MTTTTTTDYTVTTDSLTTIPLSNLIPSKANVRRTGASEGIDELVASIRAHGLRQGLNVRPVPDSDHRFEVVAGGRRLKALRILAKEKHIAKDFPVPCRVLTGDEDAAEISLAENVVRVAMHPADQFEAFHALVEKGHTLEDVAQRFGVEAALVERRLKLAGVAPTLFKAYRRGDLTLDCLMAFTVTDDHERQLEVWKSRRHQHLSPYAIRQSLTEGSLPTSHRLALFVGLDSYVAAGGGINRDLFDTKNDGYLTDTPLLMQLAADKMEAAEQEVLAEGWKWTKGEFEPDYRINYQHLPSLNAYHDDEDEAEGYEDEDGYDEDEAPAGLNGAHKPLYGPDDMARAGAILRIDRDGGLQVQRGLVHPDDWRQPDTKAGMTAKAKPDAAKGEYAATIIEDLTAHRTAALRCELASAPSMALAVVVHAMALKLFYPYSSTPSCMKLRLEQTDLARRVKALGDCSAHAGLQAQMERWQETLPKDPADLFGWCLHEATPIRLVDLLAFCTAMAVDAVQGKFDKAGCGPLQHADQLAEALDLDMTKHWQGTAEGFYGAVPKAALLHAVTEAKAPMQVSISSDLKKHEAARYVAKAMAGTGWLPAALRPAVPVADDAEVRDEEAGEEVPAEAVAA